MFARELTDDLASLVKQLDEVVGKHEEDKKLAGFVVLLSENPDADESKVVAFAEKHGIKKTLLTIFKDTTGPPNYKLAKEADVTVHMWVKKKVQVNQAFARGELKAPAIKDLLADTAKILN